MIAQQFQCPADMGTGAKIQERERKAYGKLEKMAHPGGGRRVSLRLRSERQSP